MSQKLSSAAVVIGALRVKICLSIFQMENLITGVKDTNLKLTLAFGIGIHHAGLVERDRKMTEELFVNSKIQVSIANICICFKYHIVISIFDLDILKGHLSIFDLDLCLKGHTFVVIYRQIGNQFTKYEHPSSKNVVLITVEACIGGTKYPISLEVNRQVSLIN